MPPAEQSGENLRAELTASNAALRQSRRDLSAGDDARKEAVRADQAKDKFLAMLSHELRTPLSPVLMMATLRETDPSIPEAIRQDFATIRRNIELQLGMIDDLFDLTAITHGKMRLRKEPVNLHPILRTVVDICKSDAQKKGLTIEFAPAAMNDVAQGDGGRLSQVYWNLLRNSIKFTPKGGTVVLRTANKDGTLVTSVSDTGIGMDAQAISRIFEAFDQGDAQVGIAYGGLGLGLAISKAIVDLHGGDILAESDGSGRGSCFTVTMPNLFDGVRATVMAAPVLDPARRLHILIVDDHEDTARVMERLLRMDGHTTRTAGSVSDALGKAAAETFDLLISDIGLPDASGYELMRTLGERHGVPGIALSGYGGDADLQASTEAGFSQHLTKPISFTVLRSAVLAIAGTGHLRRENAMSD